MSNLSRPSVLKIYRGVKSRVDLSNNLKVPVDKDIYKPKIPSFSFFNLNNSVALSCKKHEWIKNNIPNKYGAIHICKFGKSKQSNAKNRRLYFEEKYFFVLDTFWTSEDWYINK